MGFLGDVKRESGSTKYTALLPTGSSTLDSLIGRSCVLKSGSHDDTARINIAVGVIAIARVEDGPQQTTTAKEVTQFESESQSATTEPPAANRLDCIHRKTNEYNRKKKTPDNDNNNPDQTTPSGIINTQTNDVFTSGWIALIVCVTIGSIGCVCGGIGWWYVKNKRQQVADVLEKAKLIREQVPSVSIDPDFDIACPPPPENVLQKSAENRRQAGIEMGKAINHDYSKDTKSDQPPPGHQRVASSRFNTQRRPMSVQMRSLPRTMSEKTIAPTQPKIGHARSKTVTQFRQNKQYAQKNARNLIQANVNFTEGMCVDVVVLFWMVAGCSGCFLTLHSFLLCLFFFFLNSSLQVRKLSC